MKRYSIPPDSATVEALRRLQSGIAALRIVRGHPQHPGCAACEAQAADGRIIRIVPSQRDLQSRFEVFPIGAVVLGEAREVETSGLSLPAPVTVTLLETEDWLDPTVPCEETLGANPIMQCQGQPGEAPDVATAACTFVGGVRLKGANGQSIVIATASFPCTLHVQGLAEDKRFRLSAYRPVA